MSSSQERLNQKITDKHNARQERLAEKSMDGALAASEFRLLQQFMLEQKSNIMDVFESTDTLDIEMLQEAHRTYRNLCALDDFFMERIKIGEQSQNSLNSLQEKAK